MRIYFKLYKISREKLEPELFKLLKIQRELLKDYNHNSLDLTSYAITFGCIFVFCYKYIMSFEILIHSFVIPDFILLIDNYQLMQIINICVGFKKLI